MDITRREFLQTSGVSLSAIALVSPGLISQVGQPQGQQAQGQQVQNLLAGVSPLTEADYSARREKARKLMSEKRVDAVFLTGGTNLLYFTNLSWGTSERTFGAVLNRKGEPIWVCPAFELERAKERLPKGQEVRVWEEHESPYKLVGQIMKDLGFAGGTLGVAPDVRSFIYFGLKNDAVGVTVTDGAVITDGCRGVKSEKEIGYMELANKITKLAYQEGFKSLREGMSTGELSSAISSAARRLGGSTSGGPQFGPNTAFPHGSSAVRMLQQGDNVMVDGGGSVQGFNSDVTRTVVFGTPGDKQKKVWEIVRKAQVAALTAVRPGATCESVDIAARKVIEDAGYGPGYKYFAHRLGHGIGMEGHEYPYLVMGNKLKLEPGMTFSNEPGIYIYGEFGLRIEDCMVVTEDGGRLLGGYENTAIDKPFGD